MTDPVQISFDDITSVCGSGLALFFEAFWHYILLPIFIGVGCIAIIYWTGVLIIHWFAPLVIRVIVRFICSLIAD